MRTSEKNEKSVRHRSAFIFFSLITVLALAAPLLKAEAEETLPPVPKGPLLLTSVKPEQLNPGYWINRLEDPGRILKTPAELAEINEDVHFALSHCVDIFKMDGRKPGLAVRDQLELEYGAVKGRVLYDVQDERIPKSFFEEKIVPLVAIKTVPDRIPVKWGAAVRPTSVRALPTEVKMLEAKGDIEFDQLQFTLIKLWTPVGILHTSSDGKWYYIQAAYTRGWVKARDIALFDSRDQLRTYAKSPEFLVVTGESVPLYADPGLTGKIQQPSMGTILPLKSRSKTYYAVWIPERGGDGKALLTEAYLDLASDVSKGFPPYTQGNIIRQAFKLLGARYGWGGTYNGRDCSGFTQDVFLSMGVEMPRNAKDQVYVGTQLDHFEYKGDRARRLAVLKAATPGVTLFRMPKHQMLYLGEVNGRFYVIHSTWAERISMSSDEKNRINQVVVSDLDLNGRSYLGSLEERIISASEVR